MGAELPAQAAFCADPASAMTRAPDSAAICTAAVPTPLAAAFTTTVSSLVTLARCRTQYQAESQAMGSVAASVSSTPSGRATTWVTGTAANSA